MPQSSRGRRRHRAWSTPRRSARHRRRSALFTAVHQRGRRTGAHLCLQAVVGDIGAVSIGGHQEATGNVEAGARHVGEGAACCRARVSRQPAGVACGARARCIFRAPLPPTLSSAFCSVSSGTHVLPVLAEAQVRTPRDTPAWMGRRRLLVAMFLLPRVPIGMQKDSQQTSTEQWIRSATIDRGRQPERSCAQVDFRILGISYI